MFLSRFGVKNYKCLGEIDIPLTPLHVLIGQNDAGKTSLLEAMAAFYESSRKPLAGAFPGPWNGRELVSHGSRDGTVEFSAEWSSTQDGPSPLEGRLRYGISCQFAQVGGGCTVTKEWIEQAGTRRDIPQDVAGSGRGTSLYWRCRGTPQSAGLNLDPALASLRVEKYSLDARTMRVPATINPDRRFRLDPDGFGLPTLLDDFLGHDPELFLKVRDEFCKYFPQFKSVRVQTEPALARTYNAPGMDTASVQTGKGIVFEMRSGQTVRAQQASDGAILFLGFLALAHLPEPPSLLLIEEPENGIYPISLEKVIQLLRWLVCRTEGPAFPQIILSTHSPYVLTSFKPEEVTLLSRPRDNPEGPVRARPLSRAPHIRERLAADELYLGELWYNFTEEEISAMPEADVVIEIFGEGKADIGAAPGPGRPTEGIIPILLHKLCGKPAQMRVRCEQILFLQRKKLHQKVQVAKQRAHDRGSHAAVFVVDSEGGPRELKAKRAQLEQGRDFKLLGFPMAIGVAQPCIESWLLADAAAIRRGLELARTPAVPAEPESLPAPCKDDARNPKRVLCELAGVERQDLSADEKDRIAAAMNDLDLVRARCPLGFAPFADEAERHVRGLF